MSKYYLTKSQIHNLSDKDIDRYADKLNDMQTQLKNEIDLWYNTMRELMDEKLERSGSYVYTLEDTLIRLN